MKKRISSLALLLAMLLVLAVPALAAGQLDCVTDASGILTGEEWQSLNDQATAISEEFGCGVYLVIVDDYTDFGSSMEDAADNIYVEYTLGYGDDYNAILLLMSMSERDYWLRSYGEFGKEALTTHGGEDLAEAFLPYLGNDDWYGGFTTYIDEAYRFIAAAASGDPIYSQASEFGRHLGIALIPGALLAFIVCTIFKSRMKSAQKRTEAKEYIRDDGIQISFRDDRYTHTTTTRTKIERSSSSGSGGGGGSTSGGCSTGGKF